MEKGIKMFAMDTIKFVQGHLLGSSMLVCPNIIMTISHICLAITHMPNMTLQFKMENIG